MANFKKFLWTLAALPLLVGCSDDPKPNSSAVDEFLNGEGDGVYMNVDFRPYSGTGSRSYTSDENMSDHGTETGTDSENNINRVLLVLTDADDIYFSSAYVESNKMGVSSDRTVYQTKAKFTKTDIAGLYSSVAADNTEPIKVHVYVYCNPNAQLNTMIDQLEAWDNDPETMPAWRQLIWNIDDNGSIWAENGFLMTNLDLAVRNFPPTLDAWNFYTTENNPFDLSGMNNAGTSNEVDNQTKAGSVSVHRMAARFDFADGSQFTADDVLYQGQAWNGNGLNNKEKPFTYAVMTKTVKEEGSDVEKVETIVNCKIINMSLVNMLNAEYYLERVSATGGNTTATILGPELPWFSAPDGKITKAGNYVVSPYAYEKRNNLIKENYRLYLKYPFFDENGNPALRGNGWDTVDVADVVGNKDNKYPKDGTGKYNVWRYVTENTLPGDADGTSNYQINGLSTGIVFRAVMQAGEHLEHSSDYWDKQLYKALTDDNFRPILYLFSGNLYCSWDNVLLAALKAAGWDETKDAEHQNLDRAATLYQAVFGDGGTGTITVTTAAGTSVTYTDKREVKDEAGNTVYEDYAVDKNSVYALWKAWFGNSTSANPPATTGDKWEAFQAAAVAQMFTLYEKYEDKYGWGYYCYYYYWNRHNDNYNNGVMGPMEFATVRNNVYKIAVTRLSTLGHPRIPQNDPDSPTPDTPDEKGDLYLTVSVQVVPWVVRFNNVEF